LRYEIRESAKLLQELYLGTPIIAQIKAKIENAQMLNQANNLILDIKDNRDKDNNKDNKSLSNLNIPLDPQLFYQDFGYLLHSKTGEYVQLMPYQYNLEK
jgi:hypothetical protein